MTHLVVGPEGSGTTLFSKILRDHPDTGWVYHCSFPTPADDAHAYAPDGKAVLVKWTERFGPGAIAMPGRRRKPRWPAMCFADINGIDPDGRMTLWVCCRDRSCTTKSQLRRRIYGERSCEEQSVFGRDVELQRLYIEEQLGRREGPVVWVSYETLVQWSDHYLRRKFAEAGLDPNRFPYDNLDLADQNAKWIRDP